MLMGGRYDVMAQTDPREVQAIGYREASLRPRRSSRAVWLDDVSRFLLHKVIDLYSILFHP
jgi:hypothetical protein